MAMDFLPPAVVRLVADIKDFQAGMMKAEAQLAGVGQGGMKAFGAVGAAAGLAALAVGAFAIKLGKDAVEAAIEDEKSMRLLNQTLINTGHAGSLPGVEQGISKMMQATGIADEELRPAFQRLVLATGDITKSQEGLQLALDISAGTGKDLGAVTMALSRAYSGSTTALSRLGAGLDASVLKSKDMNLITAELQKKFGGDAAVAADTYAGKLKRISTAASEAQEKVGYELLSSLDAVAEALGGADGAVGLIDATGTAMADATRGAGLMLQQLIALTGGTQNQTDEQANLLDSTYNLLGYFGSAGAAAKEYYYWVQGMGEADRTAAEARNNSIAASESYWSSYIRTLGVASDSTQQLSFDEEQLAERAREVKAAFLDLNNALSARGSLLDYRSALSGLGDDLDDTSTRLDGFGKKSVTNQQAVIDVLQKAEAAAKTWGDKTGATADEVQAKFQTFATEIRQQLIDQGFKPEDVDRFFGTVGVWQDGGQAASSRARQAGMRAGKALGDGITAGLEASKSKAAVAAEDLMDAAERAARRRGQIESPSKVWYEIGSQLVEGLSNALGDKKGAAAEKARGIIEALGTEFDAAKERYQNTFDTLFDGLDLDHAVEQAQATGSTIAYQFIAQADEAQKFGTKLQQLIAAGLNENTWRQIAGMSASRGIQVADAYLNGNTAQMVAQTNQAVNAARAVADETGKQAAAAFKKSGTDSAIQTLQGLIEELLPEGKQRKRLMKVMDDLAAALTRTATITVVTVNGPSPAVAAAVEAPVSGSPYGQYAPQGLGGPIVIPSGEGRIFAEMVAAEAAAGRVREYAEGGWVSGIGAKPAMVHGGEFVLSGDMLAGRQDVPREVLTALSRGGQAITVNAQTNADPYAIGRELAWTLKVGA